jgi:hypothetical protein
MTYKKFLEQTEKAKTEFIKRIRQYEDVTSKEIDNIEISWDYIRISLYFQTEKNEFEHIWEYDGTKDELFSLYFDVK